jgi:hypothetical protein
MVSNWADVVIQVLLQQVSSELWWNEAMQGRPKHVVRRVAAILMCTA